MRYAFFTGLFYFTILKVFAQVPSYIHYEVENGLLSNEIYNIKQDKKGFLWIGSDGGLSRFNGYSFKHFANKQMKGTSVSGIQEDKQGNIWCHNFSGQVFNIKKDSLHLYKPWTPHYNNQLIEIALDQDDHLYISNFNNYIYRFNLTNDSNTTFMGNQSVKQSVFYHPITGLLYTNLSVGKINRLTNGTAKDLYLSTPPQNGETLKVLNTFVFFPSSAHKKVLGFQRQHLDDRFPTLLTVADNQLFMHPITAWLRKQNVYPLSVLDDDEGNLMVGTYKGCYWFKMRQGVWVLENRLFANKAISSIIKDREGSFWLATLKNGLYQIPDLSIQMLSKEVTNITDNQTGVLATNGIDRVFVAGSTTQIIELAVPTHQVNKEYQTTESRDVQSMYYDTMNKRLLYYKSNFSVIDKNGLRDNAGQVGAAKDFFVRQDGVIFTAGVLLAAIYPKGYNKVLLANEFEEARVPVLPKNNIDNRYFNSFVISNQRTKALWYDSKAKILWSANADATTYYKNKQNKILYDAATHEQVAATCFQQLKNGLLCIGTVEQGVYLVQDTTIVKRFTTQNGLLSNRIKKIRTNGDDIWIASSAGVQRLQITTNNFYTLTVAGGLASSEIFDIALAAGNLYVSTAKGLQYLPLNIKVQSQVRPYLGILKISSGNNLFNADRPIKLKSDSKNISFWLDGVTLKSKGNFYYQYKLNGLDTNWVTVAAANNVIRYPSLPPGEYIFTAVCINESGIKSEPVQIKITVPYPWWQKWWLIVLAFMLLGVSVYYLTRLSQGRKRKKIEEALRQSKTLEELRQSQLTSLKAQMNPHFMFNALNSIQEFILLNEKRQANMYMGKFADLMRLTLDLSNRATITLEEELRTLNLYLELEALRFEEQFSYTIQLEKIEDTAAIEVPPMLIQPYVENAVKHGLLHKQGTKKLDIQFTLFDKQLLCMVSDNGIGRKRSAEIKQLREKKYNSFASGATQKRLELLNHDKPRHIAVMYYDYPSQQEQLTGTRVEISIPV